MERYATHLHKCNKCGGQVLAYRDCSNETHQDCIEIVNGRPFGGQLKLIQAYTLEQAKENKLVPSWIKGE